MRPSHAAVVYASPSRMAVLGTTPNTLLAKPPYPGQGKSCFWQPAAVIDEELRLGNIRSAYAIPRGFYPTRPGLTLSRYEVV